MNLTYRTRRILKRVGITALIVFLASVLIWACWVVWLDRYIVYTRDGAVLDFNIEQRYPAEGQLAVPPVPNDEVSVYYNDGSDTEELDTELRQISGYYVNADMLSTDMDTVRATVAALPVGSAVMIEVKNIKGNFYYSTNIEDAVVSSDVDAEAVDGLISDIASRNLYLIATLPAFRDRHYGLEKTSCGLPFIGGQGALWLDDSNCYWLDPTKDGTIEYLTAITEELKALGFDEVVFSDFRFPDSQEIDFSGNRITAVQVAATNLVTACTTDRFAVSFIATGSSIQPVTGRSRLYLTDVEAENAENTAAAYSVEDPAINLAFLTDSYDTRYEICSVLRPMESAAMN